MNPTTSHGSSGRSRFPPALPRPSPANSKVPETPQRGVRVKDPTKTRVSMYSAQALIDFNVYGIPLSFGPYLEYYYTTRFPTTSLPFLSLIIAVQLLAIFSTGLLAESMYRLKWAHVPFLVIGTLASGSYLVCLANGSWWFLVIFQGLVPGMALGLLRMLSILYLASHYRGDVPLTSMQSIAAGLFGAMWYTGIAWVCLRYDDLNAAFGCTFALMAITLLGAFVLLHRYREYGLQRTGPSNVRLERGAVLFQCGYYILFVGLFIWPTYLVLLLCSPPSYQFPDIGAYTLLATFAAGIVPAAYFPRETLLVWLGPVNTFIPLSLVAGVCYFSPAWMPYWAVLGSYSVVYGVVLGPILAFHVRVLVAFYAGTAPSHPDMLRRICYVSVGNGCAAFIGVVSMAMLIQFTGGFAVALPVFGSMMLLGGLLMVGGRFMRCRKLYVVI